MTNLLWGVVYSRVVKRQKKLALRNQAKENALEGNSNGHANINIGTSKDDADKESTI